MADTRMKLAEWLDDLCVRFIINLPQEELESVERICFQVEEAQWFYEDFVRPLDPSLPSMNLRSFCLLIFKVCPFLSGYSEEQHLSAYSQFLAYKTRVPVRGAIMLNEEMDHVVLVKGWKKGSNWSFPRGKINKDERDLDCAIREVYEETGFDIAAAGLVTDGSNENHIEVTMREQHMQLYVFRNVPMDTPFAARTRKEISKISWWKLSSLPGYQKKKQIKQINDEEGSLSANKLYMVAPFLVPLKKWIARQRKMDKHLRTNSNMDNYLSAADGQLTDGDALADDDMLSDVPTIQMPTIAASLQAPRPTNTSERPLDLSTDSGPAAQMKRMLGVGLTIPPVQHEQVQQTPSTGLGEQPNNLLALLRGGSQASSSMQHGSNTPYNQGVFGSVNTGLGQLSQPQPTRFLESQTAGAQPFAPRDSFSNQQRYGHEHYPSAQHGSNGFGYDDLPRAPGSNGLYASQMQPPQPTYNQPPPGMGFHPQELSSLGAPQDTRRITQAPPPPAPPYQRTGDPLVVQQPSDPNLSAPGIPAASELPIPKLSAHATSLLDAFKKPSISQPKPSTLVQLRPAPTSPPPMPAQAPPAPHIGPLQTPEVPKPQPQPPSRSNSIQAFAGLIPSNVTPVSRRDSGTNAVDPMKRKASTHQNTLLGLFKAPATPKTPAASSGPLGPPNALPIDEPAAKQPSSTQDALLDLFKSAPAVKKEVAPASPAPAIFALASQYKPADPAPEPVVSKLANNQDTLLGLFKNLPAPKQAVIAQEKPDRGTLPPTQPTANTAGLPAAPPIKNPWKIVTAPQPPQPALQQEPAEARVSLAKVPKILQRPMSASKEVPAPEVVVPEMPAPKGPASLSPMPAKLANKLAETGTVVRRKPKVPSTTTIKDARPRTPTGPSVQILKRPADAPRESPSPLQPVKQATEASVEASAHHEKHPAKSLKKAPQRQNMRRPTSSSSRKEERPTTPSSTKAVNGTPSKPAFQPQILRRPKQSPLASSASPVPATDAAVGPKQTMEHQRQNLLSLFTKQPTRPLESSPIVTPTSAKGTGLLREGMSPKLELSRSRINSIASPPVLASPSRMSSYTSAGPALMPGGDSQSGSRTPISPADKGFLLNYLEGVVKGVPR